ncbi:MAG: hypothetical protein C3F11_10410 [Methylocystaceae bacterium]|nr:MAG: hypothetical protein C3F11_10410 [Methylocystaceae bacterium]
MSTFAVEPSRFSNRQWIRLLLLCTAILFEGMSLSSINVQLAHLQRDIVLREDQLSLVSSVFFIAYAGLLLVSGRCADQWGSRRMFMSGIALFGLGSLGSGLAEDAAQLIASRALQGVGAAINAPASFALIVAEFPAGPARNRAIGIFSAMGAVGFSSGLALGGFFTAWFGWRSAFYLYVPLSVLVLAAAPFLLGDSDRFVKGRIAWLQALVVTSGLVMVVYAISRFESARPFVAFTIGVAGAFLVGAFFLIQARVHDPLIPLPLLADSRVMGASVALAGAFAAVTGAMFSTAISIQNDYGYSPSDAGLIFLPQGLAVGLLSTHAARLADRRSPIQVLLFGLVVVASGQVLYVLSAAIGYADRLLPGVLLVGAGIAAAYPAAVMLASAAAGPDEQGVVSGILVTSQQFGSAFGAPVATLSGTLLLSARGGENLAGLWSCVGLAMLTVVISAILLTVRPPPVTGVS